MKYLFITIILLLVSMAVFGKNQDSQDEDSNAIPNAVIAPNFAGPLFGYYSGTFEFALSKKTTLEVEPGYWNYKLIPLIGPLASSNSDFWFGYAKVGPNFYFDDRFNSFFIGPYARGSYFVFGDSTTSISSASLGGGVRAGWRWTWDWFSLGLGGGFEYNHAFASLNAYGSNVTSSVEGGFGYGMIEMGIALYDRKK